MSKSSIKMKKLAYKPTYYYNQLYYYYTFLNTLIICITFI